ncbi:unnamed protein product, partial [Mesorhabditis spiculigera]
MISTVVMAAGQCRSSVNVASTTKTIHIDIETVMKKFQGRLVNAENVDFSDSIAAKGKRSYGSTGHVLEVIGRGTGEPETPAQKFNRLYLEISELGEEISSTDSRLNTILSKMKQVDEKKEQAPADELERNVDELLALMKKWDPICTNLPSQVKKLNSLARLHECDPKKKGAELWPILHKNDNISAISAIEVMRVNFCFCLQMAFYRKLPERNPRAFDSPLDLQDEILNDDHHRNREDKPGRHASHPQHHVPLGGPKHFRATPNQKRHHIHSSTRITKVDN